jgi:hypothetical protein
MLSQMRLSYKIIESLIYGMMILVAVWQLFLSTGQEFKEGVDAVDWLPKEASDITYFEREGLGWVKHAEFTMAREDFDEWVQTKEWKLVSEENVTARRPSKEGHKSILIKKALVYDNRQPNGGGLTLIYNIENKRAYFESSHR